MVQGTDEWFSARLGKVTASRIGDIMSKTKSGYSASRKNYMSELICERLTKKRQESFTNAAMQWGTDTEPLAREEYEAATLNPVEEAGLIDHPTIENFGASPDGLIGEDGGLEIKCPNTATHIEYLRTKKIPKNYILQMQTAMACTGRKWWDFVTFDPRMPSNMQMMIIRVNRDDELIGEIEYEVSKFNDEVNETVSALLEEYGDTE